MTILALDVGNTHIVIGCIKDNAVSGVFRLSTNTSKTADEYAAEIRGILAFHDAGRAKFDGAVMSCVVPPLSGVLRNAVKQLAGINAMVVGAGVRTGLNILIDDPAQLGGDMVASAVGALAEYAPPIIIADLGTATKMFALSRNGSFLGGAILPGVAISMDALAAGAAQLMRVQLEAPAKCISTNTADCMKSGSIFGAASAIDGMAARFEAELGEPATVVATGGLAGLVCRHCKREIVQDPHLILRGLGIIFEKNRKK